MKVLTCVFIVFIIVLSAKISSAQEIKFSAADTWNWPVRDYANGDRSINSHFWVDVSIENLGFEKDVAIIWTTNNWHSWNETKASYEKKLEDGREQWGADVLSVGRASERYYGYFWNHLYEQDSNDFNWLDSDACDYSLRGCSVQVEFAVRYIDTSTGEEFWENNNGENHKLFLEARFQSRE